jgi:DMSO reductase anchor subunit
MIYASLRTVPAWNMTLVPVTYLALALLFAVPLIAALASALWPGWAAPLLALATLSASLGVWLERWLFFAEAEHLSMLYYPEAAGA